MGYNGSTSFTKRAIINPTAVASMLSDYQAYDGRALRLLLNGYGKPRSAIACQPEMAPPGQEHECSGHGANSNHEGQEATIWARPEDMRGELPAGPEITPGGFASCPDFCL